MHCRKWCTYIESKTIILDMELLGSIVWSCWKENYQPQRQQKGPEQYACLVSRNWAESITVFFKKGRKSDLLVLPSATEIILLNSKPPTQNRTLCQLVYLERGKYSHRFFFSATLNIYFETYLTFLLNKSCFNYSDNLSYAWYFVRVSLTTSSNTEYHVISQQANSHYFSWLSDGHQHESKLVWIHP